MITFAFSDEKLDAFNYGFLKGAGREVDMFATVLTLDSAIYAVGDLQAIRANPAPAIAGAHGVTPLNDPYQWVIGSDYPSEALRSRTGGVVGFRLAVSANGKITACSIVQSSGVRSLDEATCRLVMDRALFEPGKDAVGHPTGGNYFNHVRWIVAMPSSAPEAYSLVKSYVVERDGSESHCRIDRAEGASPEKIGPIACSEYPFSHSHHNNGANSTSKLITESTTVTVTDVPNN